MSLILEISSLPGDLECDIVTTVDLIEGPKASKDGCFDELYMYIVSIITSLSMYVISTQLLVLTLMLLHL